MFVTFEGIDGSGKSTQADLLRVRLEAEGIDVLGTREPGGTELGEKIRDLLLHGGHVTAWAEALLYAASRAQHVEELVRPALARGAWVVCDRYLDSSVAYQGVARGLGLDRVLDLNLAAVGGLLPDRTFLLELAVSELPERLRGDHDRLEQEADDFHARVGEGYRELAARYPERIVVLDAARPPEELAEEVYGALPVRT